MFCVQFSSFSEFIFFKNCSYNLYFFFDHFTKPLVTQGLLKLFGLFLIFYLEMLHWKDPRELLKIHCMQFFGIFLKYTFPVNDREKSFKIGYRFIIYIARFVMCVGSLLESSIKSFEIRNIGKWSEISAVIIPECMSLFRK